MRYLAYLLILTVLLQAQPSFAKQPNWNDALQKQIQEWINDIAQQDPQFFNWRQARTEVQTLGANQHQWLVSLQKAGKQVGYLVVAEAEQKENGQKPKFVLLEYGVGEFILFDDTFAPKNVAAEPVYDGFSSYWRVAQNDSMRYVDAKTGERYPATSQPDPYLMDSLPTEELAESEMKLTKTRLLLSQETNPFDQIGWIQQLNSGQGSSAVSWQTLLQEPSNKPVVLNVFLFQKQVMAPFTVGSVHLWDKDAAYIGVWDEGLRFLPFAYTQKVGTYLFNE
nr:hypothetical protein [Brevibacillus fulvus]